MKCTDCTEEKRKTIDDYYFKECGLDNVCLQNVDVLKCGCNTSPHLPIQEMDKINFAIIRQLVTKIEPLNIKEFNYVRKILVSLATRDGLLAAIIGFINQDLIKTNDLSKLDPRTEESRTITLKLTNTADDNLVNTMCAKEIMNCLAKFLDLENGETMIELGKEPEHYFIPFELDFRLRMLVSELEHIETYEAHSSFCNDTQGIFVTFPKKSNA